MARVKGRFVVLEGPDKSGKSTQAGMLVGRLNRLKIPVVHTREPGGTTFAEAIRRILLDPKHEVDPIAELLLYEAARAQHTAHKLRPALAAGAFVLCERYTLATLAYQGYARKIPLKLVRQLNTIATGGLKPDLTIVLDIPESEFGSRHRAHHDRLEQENSAFRRRVREGYRALARKMPGVALLNGRLPVTQLSEEIFGRVERLLP
jgi:dTMP kinase